MIPISSEIYTTFIVYKKFILPARFKEKLRDNLKRTVVIKGNTENEFFELKTLRSLDPSCPIIAIGKAESVESGNKFYIILMPNGMTWARPEEIEFIEDDK